MKVIIRIRIAQVNGSSRVRATQMTVGQTCPRCGWGELHSIEHFELDRPDRGGTAHRGGSAATGRWDSVGQGAAGVGQGN